MRCGFPEARRRAVPTAALIFFLVGTGAPAVRGQSDEGLVKTIRGVVQDLAGEPVPGARVFVYSRQNNETRTLRTDEAGLYVIHGLPGDADYELRATYEDAASDSRLVTSFLSREDNVVNFTLELVIERQFDLEDGPAFDTFDGVRLAGSFELPEGIPAPIPVALLLHGYGETRSVWTDLTERLLTAGWAVLAMDLRGHGQSRMRGQETLSADTSWRLDPQQFPLDLEPALDWLKTHPRLDTNRIAVIGSDVGAGLALIAASRYREVATAVALNPNLDEALSMAGTARDFAPGAAHIVVTDRAVGEGVRDYVTGPNRITVLNSPPASNHTAVWLGTRDTIGEILRWLRDTY